MLFYVLGLLVLTFRSFMLKLSGFYCLVPLWLFVPCSQILVESPHYWFTAAVCCNLVFTRRFRLVLSAPARKAFPPQTPLPQS